MLVSIEVLASSCSFSETPALIFDPVFESHHQKVTGREFKFDSRPAFENFCCVSLRSLLPFTPANALPIASPTIDATWATTEAVAGFIHLIPSKATIETHQYSVKLVDAKLLVSYAFRSFASCTAPFAVKAFSISGSIT